MPDAAAIEMLNAVGSFDVAMDVNGLIEIKFTVRAPMKGVNEMIRVLCPKAGKHDPLLVRFAITIGIFEIEQLGALPHINPTIARHDASRDEQAVREHRGFVCMAISFGVFENEDFVVGDLARLDLRVNRGAGNPKA